MPRIQPAIRKWEYYLIACVYFLVVFVTSITLRYLLLHRVEEPLLELIFKCSIGVIALVLMTFWLRVKIHWLLSKRISVPHIGLIIALPLCFLMHNVWMVHRSDILSYGNLGSSLLVLQVLAMLVNCFAEELLYRGGVQTYINTQKGTGAGTISKGNAVATVLMTITHFGFFTVMSPTTAITAISLVAIFSLTVGYLRDQYDSLSIPILVHILANTIHMAIHISGD